MTNEIEKQFFEKFNIPKKLYCKKCGAAQFSLALCAEVNCKPFYPPITDRILLELICIKNNELISIVQLRGKNLEELKNYILQMCIKDYMDYSSRYLSTYKELANNFKHQIQALFKENN